MNENEFRYNSIKLRAIPVDELKEPFIEDIAEWEE